MTGETASAGLAETHSAVVFFVGDRAYKLKRPVDARAERSPETDQAAAPEAPAGRWAANTAELLPYAGGLVDADDVHSVQRLAERYLAGRRPLFERRIADGHARDGDLLADDVFCLDDGPRILDCIESDDRLRYGDVLANVAFLAMDLERLGHPDLAGRFLGAYR